MPYVVPAAHYLGKDITSKKVLLPLTAGLVSLAAAKGRNFKMSRRAFSALLLAGLGTLAVACSPAVIDAIKRTYDNCKVVLPPLEQNPPEAITQPEYDKLTVFQQADYLLRGGYLKEWLPTKKAASKTEEDQSRKDFLKKIAQAAKLSIVSVYAQLMGEDVEDLKKRFFVATTNEEVKDIIRRETDIQSEEGLDKVVNESLGLQRINRAGKQIFLLNLETYDQYSNEYFASGQYTEIVRKMSDTFAHELSHTGTKNKKGQQDKTDLKNWVNQISAVDVNEVLDEPFEGLEIRFRVTGDTNGVFHSILSDSAYENQPERRMFDESLREFMERSFRRRLDTRLGRSTPTPYSSFYPEYGGYELFVYLNEKLGIPDEALVDYLNNSRHDETHNAAGFIRFFANSARRNGITVSETQVLKALSFIETSSQLMYKESDKYSSSAGKAPNKDEKFKLFDEYVCSVKDYVEAGKMLIDESFSKLPVKPTPSLKMTNGDSDEQPILVNLPQRDKIYSFPETT